jgi:hypothetical protein
VPEVASGSGSVEAESRRWTELVEVAGAITSQDHLPCSKILNG